MKALKRRDLHSSPFVQFSTWFDEAKRSLGMKYPNACCLSTLDTRGCPDGRMILLKEFGECGFVFYTNKNSVKGVSLRALPKASLTFYWESLHRQIRIQGDVTECEAIEDDEYFQSRDRASQLGAWASAQSSELHSRESLEERMSELETQNEDAPVPRPEYWGGYCLSPNRIEFWQERAGRLHDRFEYSRVEQDSWVIRALYP